MLRAKDLASSSFLPMQLYVLAAIIYFAMSYPLSLLLRRLESTLGASISNEARHLRTTR